MYMKISASLAVTINRQLTSDAPIIVSSCGYHEKALFEAEIVLGSRRKPYKFGCCLPNTN